jgi:hypothetical protein
MAATAIPAERADTVTRARAELFATFVDELNGAVVPYCLLSGYESYPEPGDSDVDFMVGPQDGAKVLGMLQAAAGRIGALLVQAMQHETTAQYFVLAKQVGSSVAYLHPDCSTDYRRDGRLWLRSSDVLPRRRRLGNIFVAAKPDEFLYYLIKKILKQEIDESQLQRLRRLYVACPEECCARMRRLWPEKQVSAVTSAILSGDVRGMQWSLPSLRVGLLTSRKMEKLRGRSVQQFRELRRRATRVMRPTGLSIAISGASAGHRDELARGLEMNLRPAFRRTHMVDENEFSFASSTWTAKVRSTLVIRKCASSAGMLFARNQIHFNLSESVPSLEAATRISLRWLANRVSN